MDPIDRELFAEAWHEFKDGYGVPCFFLASPTVFTWLWRHHSIGELMNALTAYISSGFIGLLLASIYCLFKAHRSILTRSKKEINELTDKINVLEKKPKTKLGQFLAYLDRRIAEENTEVSYNAEWRNKISKNLGKACGTTVSAEFERIFRVDIYIARLKSLREKTLSVLDSFDPGDLDE